MCACAKYVRKISELPRIIIRLFKFLFFLCVDIHVIPKYVCTTDVVLIPKYAICTKKLRERLKQDKLLKIPHLHGTWKNYFLKIVYPFDGLKGLKCLLIPKLFYFFHCFKLINEWLEYFIVVYSIVLWHFEKKSGALCNNMTT